VVLTTGLNRQIRRMFVRMGYEVKKLVRTRIGPWDLKGLPEGAWRVLVKRDLVALERQGKGASRG